MVDVGALSAWLRDHEVRTVRLIGANHDGRLQGKLVPAGRFEQALPAGVPITDSVFVLGPDGEPALGWDVSGLAGDLGDMMMRPDLATLTLDPRLPSLASVFCDYYTKDGQAVPVCPRGVLKGVLARLGGLGYEVQASFELEAVAFAESGFEASDKGYRGLRRLGSGSSVEYRTHRPKEVLSLMDAISLRFEGLGLEWETMIDEWGDGLFEITTAPAVGVAAADNATRGRLAILEVADELDRTVTFMPVPESHGSVTGCHLNLSLTRDGDPVFYDAAGELNHSQVMRHFLGGVMEAIPAATSFMYPSVNAYRRVADLSSAPSHALWGEDNKTVAVRTVARDPGTARIEYRLPAGDANPYLVLAAVVAGGLFGLETRVDPPPPFDGMGWALPHGMPRLPGTINEAIEELDRDKMLTDILGEQLVDHWLGSRRWEAWQFEESTHVDRSEVTDWELQRYFDGI